MKSIIDIESTTNIVTFADASRAVTEEGAVITANSDGKYFILAFEEFRYYFEPLEEGDERQRKLQDSPMDAMIDFQSARNCCFTLHDDFIEACRYFVALGRDQGRAAEQVTQAKTSEV